MKLDIVDFAHQVIDMQERIHQLEREKTELLRYKEQYDQLLDSSMQHNQAMMANLLNLFMTPGVVESCQKNQTFGVEE